MYLKSIEISGFKSFAKKSALTFTTPISAIVGPNGSGKSNVAEAFRFVLGEQSMKSLRGKKGEDLIFNGADGGARSNRASVKVVFDNSKKVFSVDFPEVSVERVVHRDGVNEYFINDSQVRLKDVVELLAHAHIGASGHHIISQGEADRILNATPRERKAMLEDSLGLKIYQYKRLESERKLEKTAENIQSVESLRREIAPHLRFLKRQVEKIEKAQSLKDELLTLGGEYLKREELFITDSHEKLKAEKGPLLEKEEQLKKEMNEARTILDSSSKKDEKSDRVMELEKNMESLRSEKDAVLQDMGKIEGEIHAERKILLKQKEILASNEHKTVPLRDVEDMISSAEEKLEGLGSTPEPSMVVKIVAEVKALFLSFVRNKKEASDDQVIKESEEAIATLTKRKEETEKKLVDIRSREVALQKEYQTVQDDINREKDSSRDAEKALFRIMSEQNEVSGTLALLHSREETLRLVEEEFKREREECALLVGRNILQYSSLVLNTLEEPRSEQDERKRAIQKIKIRLEEAGLSGSGEVLKEFQETSERDAFLERELHDLYTSAETLKNLIRELGEKLDLEFQEGIGKINKQFGEFFALMFGGGQAKLSVVKEKKRKRRELDEDGLSEEGEEETGEEEEAEEGIDVEVSLPRKKIKGLVMLSGGERALTSIALLFAISQVNPPPFIILDETDAALDEANSRKYGDMIENLARYSQLILITHNRETMSRAGVIYGVTMGMGGISKLLSIQFDEAVAVAK